MNVAVVMIGEPAEAISDGVHQTIDPESWVMNARRQAARDLISQLSLQPKIDHLIVVSPVDTGLDLDIHIEFQVSKPGPVHVGRVLAQIAERTKAERLMYFGGGSAPLLSDSMINQLLSDLSSTTRGLFVNNEFASDWAGITPASTLIEWQERLPLDNMLAWVLSTEAGLPVVAQPASAATRLDIDTPTDLLILRLHPQTGPNLSRFLRQLPLPTRDLQETIAVLRTPASHVFISGRLGPDAWKALNKASHCWLRVIAEERGMVSSGRLSRGEVYSLLAEHLAAVGLNRFFQVLSEQAQAAFIDTRVLLAHHNLWPPPRDRYASDLGMVEQIENRWLKEFSAAAVEAPLPIVLGGHGLLAGDLFALCELL